MSITKFDVKILVSMSIVVIAMNFIFPPLGLAGDKVSENDIPQFNLSKNTFEFVDQRQEFPNNPTQGELIYIDDNELHQDERQIWLQREDSGDDYVLSFTNLGGNLSHPGPQWTLTQFNSTGSVVDDETTVLDEGEFDTMDVGDYELAVETTSIENVNESDLTLIGEWEIITGPSDTTWYNRIPVIGTIFGAGEALAGIVGWGISIIWDVVYNFIVFSTNLFIVISNLIGFFIDFIVWLSTTYFAIVSGAPTAWASLIIAIPGILLSLVFAKIIMALVNTLLNAVPLT